MLRVVRTQAVARPRNGSDPSPLAIRHLEDVEHERARRSVAFTDHHAAVLILDARAALLELANAHEDALEEIDGLEAADHDRSVMASRKRLVLLEAHHRADVPGAKEGLHAIAGGLQDGADRGRDEHVRDEHREVRRALRLREAHRHCVGGRRRLEADPEEDDPLGRILSGDPHGIERRIDDAHVCSATSEGLQIAA